VTRLAWMGHPSKNLARAKRWLKWLLRTFSRVDFAADWILWIEVLDDANPVERARGLAFCNTMLGRMTDYWMVGGQVSPGMGAELVTARAVNVEVVDLTFLGDEPPQDGDASWWDQVPQALAERLLFLLSDEMTRKVEERL
jgi:hypothetical protein